MKRLRSWGSKPESPAKCLSETDMGALRWHFPVRGCRLTVPVCVLLEIQTLALANAPLETGGTLVGTISKDRRRAEVRLALHAQGPAKRGRLSFFRPPDSLDRTLLSVLKDRPSMQYIGEWHTHPGGEPTPSTQDSRALREIATAQQTPTETPILLIVGRTFAGQQDVGVFLFGPGNDFEAGLPNGSGGA